MAVLLFFGLSLAILRNLPQTVHSMDRRDHTGRMAHRGRKAMDTVRRESSKGRTFWDVFFKFLQNKCVVSIPDHLRNHHQTNLTYFLTF